jgi:hypothetical protein
MNRTSRLAAVAALLALLLAACQDATNAGVLNSCPGVVEVTANDADRVPSGSWERLKPGDRRYVVSMSAASRSLWVFARLTGSTQITHQEYPVADLPRVPKDKNNYVVEATLSGSACPS